MSRLEQRTPVLVLACLGADGLPTDAPLFAAFPLRPRMLRRARTLTRLCERNDLDSVTTSALTLQPHWEFSPSARALDLSCTWTAIGVLHYFTLYGRLQGSDDPDESITRLAETVCFDARELRHIARQRVCWDVRSHDEDDGGCDVGLHRRICQRAEALMGPP